MAPFEDGIGHAHQLPATRPYVFNAAKTVKGELMGMVWNLFSTVVCGAQLTVLSLAYTLRISWYLDDI